MGKNKRVARRMECKIRINSELIKKINVLLKEYPDLYENISHVFRCAIMRLYKSEVDENGKRRKPMQYWE